jgi:hypothetical protein
MGNLGSGSRKGIFFAFWVVRMHGEEFTGEINGREQHLSYLSEKGFPFMGFLPHFSCMNQHTCGSTWSYHE